jgi:bifunctional DNA-binding transcriptional regulator/antitoxin component of YhaV-PrlF toxin-antitoxin module
LAANFGIRRGGLEIYGIAWQNPFMTATLTLDNSGRLLLPAQILRVLGRQPGVELKVEVTPGRIELLNDQEEDVPVITELAPDGTLLLPAGVKPPSAETIVAAIMSDREDRINKLSRL